jgi:hypothetical protein
VRWEGDTLPFPTLGATYSVSRSLNAVAFCLLLDGLLGSPRLCRRLVRRCGAATAWPACS